MATVKKKQIFIVDDHPLIRQAVSVLVNGDKSLSICGEAESIEDCILKINSCTPDIVIVDIGLPDGNGFSLIKRLKLQNDQLLILVLSMYDDEIMAERSLQSGAMGYICKKQAPESLLDAIKTILDGKIYLSASIQKKLLGDTSADIQTIDSILSIQQLTNRELEVFEQIGIGQSTVDIANHLNLSVKTIETYRSNIKQKLNLKTSLDLTRRAMEWSLQGSL